MKKGRTTIPKKLLEELASDPEYKICSLRGYHECEGRITWEHAIRFAGKSLQKKWSIIPLCAKGHAVDQFQDAGTMNKVMNMWVAFNRATDMELIQISTSAENYLKTREYLNKKYGVWVQPDLSEISAINY